MHLCYCDDFVLAEVVVPYAEENGESDGQQAVEREDV